MAAAAFAYRTNKHSSSDSDSDNSDEECRDWKRATRKKESPPEKIPIDPPPTETSPNTNPGDKASKRKRNNIWSEVLEDQILSESLDDIGVKQKPKGYGSRGAESYDYTLAPKYQKKAEDSDDDMSGDDDMSDSTETSSVTSSVRERRFHNKNLIKLDTAELGAAKKIIKVLAEQKHHLIFRVVKFVGVEKAMELLKMTEEIEENGGMMIRNNARRRTPGGVFLQLLRSDKCIEKSVVDRVFEGEMNSFQVKKMFEDRRKYKKKLAAKRAAEKAVLKASELPLPLTFPQPELKQEENTIKMEEDSMLVEEKPPVLQNPTPIIQEATGSDLEDGEIGD